MTEQLTRRNVLTLAGGTATVALAGCLGDDSVTAEVTAYVVPYHWGFAVFDEDGDELDEIEIEPGTELTLYAVNDHASDAFGELPDPVALEVEGLDSLGRTEAKVEAGHLPEPRGHSVEEVYQETHDHGHGDDGHGHDDDGNGHGHDDDGNGHGHDDDDNGHGADDHGHADDNSHGDDGPDEENATGRLAYNEDTDQELEQYHEEENGDEDDGLMTHGITVEDSDIDMEVPPDMHEPETQSDVFQEPGTYQVSCTIHCGYYHQEQVEDLVVVTEE